MKIQCVSEGFWKHWLNKRRIPRGIHSTNTILGWINGIFFKAGGMDQAVVGKTRCPECSLIASGLVGPEGNKGPQEKA